MDKFNKSDIKIVKLEQIKYGGLRPSKLVLSFSGKLINHTVTNTIRRLVLNDIPTYAFHKDSITIEKNTSIFNNDYMRLRLEQFPIPKIKNNIAELEEKYYKVNYADLTRLKHPDDKKIIEMYVSSKNKTKEIMNVTTNDVKFYEDGIEVQKINKKYPQLIIQLKPNQEFKCRALGVLGIGKRNNMWAGAANCFHERKSENKYELTLYSKGQMDEYELIIKSCIILKNKLKKIKSVVESENLNNKEKILKISLDNFTEANVINDFLQSNKNIIYSGVSKPDLLVNEVIIKFQAKANPLKSFANTIDYVIKIFSEIQNKISKLRLT